MKTTVVLDVEDVEAYFTVHGTSDMISGKQRLVFRSGNTDVEVYGERARLDAFVESLSSARFH